MSVLDVLAGVVGLERVPAAAKAREVESPTYTHVSLPTICNVYISVVYVSYNKKIRLT